MCDKVVAEGTIDIEAFLSSFVILRPLPGLYYTIVLLKSFGFFWLVRVSLFIELGAHEIWGQGGGETLAPLL